MPSRKIYCPGCGTQIQLDIKEEKTLCQKCKITIKLPAEWFYPPAEKKGPIPPFKPTFTIEALPEESAPPAEDIPQENASKPIAEELKTEAEITAIPSEPPPDACPRCRSKMPTPIPFQCSLCGQKFCLRCPGRHVPPGEKTMVTIVKYKYRFRGASQWKNEQIKFRHELPLVLCPDCYESEFNKGIKKLEMDVRNWYQELVQDEDAKIIEKVMPQMCPSIPPVRK